MKHVKTYLLSDERDKISDKMRFVRKVYSILAAQLSITFVMILLVQVNDSFKFFIYSQSGLPLLITCCVLSIVTMFMIVCCFGKSFPVNYFLLLIFTLSESYMIAGITCQYDKNTVMLAGLGTALVTISLTLYAMFTKVEI